MWYWKNNGPRPPYSTEEIIAMLLLVWIVKAMTVLCMDSIEGMINTITELQRRHPGW
jgi:hypothetical protein